MYLQPSPVKDLNQAFTDQPGLSSPWLQTEVQWFEFFESFHVHCFNFTWNRCISYLGCSRRVFTSPIAKWPNNDAKYGNFLVHFPIEDSFHHRSMCRMKVTPSPADCKNSSWLKKLNFGENKKVSLSEIFTSTSNGVGKMMWPDRK